MSIVMELINKVTNEVEERYISNAPFDDLINYVRNFARKKGNEVVELSNGTISVRHDDSIFVINIVDIGDVLDEFLKDEGEI